MTDHTIADRKRSHIRICLHEDVQSPDARTGLECYRLVHNALPEINLDDVDTSCTFLGKKLNLPLIVSPMTGGTEESAQLNILLAEAAQEFGIGLSVGSQRIALADSDAAVHFDVRRYAPDVLLCANLGAAQLNNGLSVDDCKKAVEMIGADVLTLHLNPIHEAVQPGGNTNFAGLLKKIEAVCEVLLVPVMVKEVGFGISADCAQRLARAGVSAIDVAGAGGTNWALVESYRALSEAEARLARSCAGWGIPTSDCIKDVRAALPEMPLVASGGIRTGTEIAKAIALGATLAGMAQPLLAVASQSCEALTDYIERIRQELALAMFGTGCASVIALKATKPLKSYCNQCWNSDLDGSRSSEGTCR